MIAKIAISESNGTDFLTLVAVPIMAFMAIMAI